jgi:TetR/AcrR family transcriptional regulator
MLDPTALNDQPPEEVLPQIAHAYLAMADRPIAQRLLRLILPEVVRRPEMVDQLGGRMIARILDFVKTYLARQVELGRLRPHDVRASARAFIGMLLPALQADGLTDKEHITTIVTIFLRGLQPEPAPSE